MKEVIMLASLGCLCLAVGSCDVATKYVPLAIEYPKPANNCVCLRGAPTIVTERWDAPEPVIRVPKGCTNLALRKPVTASDPDPIVGDILFVTDGRKDLSPAVYDSCVELSLGPQWVQIDLQRIGRIDAIAVWHNFLDYRVVYGMVVEVSNDPTFENGVITVYNSDQHDQINRGPWSELGYRESHRGKVIETGGVRARYVRLYSSGSNFDDQNPYVEVEVWGR